MPLHHDPGDAFRIALLSDIFDRMARSPKEEARIRAVARAQLDLQREERLSGEGFQALWEDLLSLPLRDLREALLGDHPEAAEYRHAHMFAGAIPAREINQIRAGLRSDTAASRRKAT